LIGVIQDNTRLELPPTSLAAQKAGDLLDRAKEKAQGTKIAQEIFGDGGSPLDKTKPWVSPVQSDTAAPTGLTHYLQQILGPILGTLQDLGDQQGGPSDTKALMDSFKQALRATSELVASSQSSFTSPLLSPLLLTPLNNGFDFV